MPPKKQVKHVKLLQKKSVEESNVQTNTPNELAVDSKSNCISPIELAMKLLSDKVHLVEKIKSNRLEAAARLRKLQLENIEALYQNEVYNANQLGMVFHCKLHFVCFPSISFCSYRKLLNY